MNNPGSISRESGSPVDKYGDQWVWDPIKNEWDVQHPDGSHTNIGPDGEITHGDDNMGRAPKPSSDGSASYSWLAPVTGGVLVFVGGAACLTGVLCEVGAPLAGAGLATLAAN